MLFEPLKWDSLWLYFWHTESESEIDACNFDWRREWGGGRETKERTCQRDLANLRRYYVVYRVLRSLPRKLG